jgi:hypothetical protein
MVEPLPETRLGNQRIFGTFRCPTGIFHCCIDFGPSSPIALAAAHSIAPMARLCDAEPSSDP